MPESTPSSATSEPTTAPAADAKPAELVVRYRYVEGILLLGFTRPHRIAVKVAMPRWRWFQSLRRWGVSRTRERVLSREQVEAYADGLTRAGVPNVRVDYQEPRPEEIVRTGAERERPGFGLRRLLELVRSAGPGGGGRRVRRGAVTAELMADPRVARHLAVIAREPSDEESAADMERYAEVVEHLAGSGTWAKRMAAVTGDRVLRWLARDVRDVLRFVHDYRAMVEPRAARDEMPRPTVAHAARDAAAASTERSSHERREEEDLTLHDPGPDSTAVDPQPCEHEPRDAGSLDSLSIATDEPTAIEVLLREVVEAAGQVASEGETNAPAEPSPMSTHGATAGEEALAGGHGTGDTGLDSNDRAPALAEVERLGPRTAPCSAELVAAALTRAPATAAAASPRPRTPYSATAPRRSPHVAPPTPLPSLTRPPVAWPSAVAWRPRPPRPLGSRSPRGPPPRIAAWASAGPQDGGPSSSTRMQQTEAAGLPLPARRLRARPRAHALDRHTASTCSSHVTTRRSIDILGEAHPHRWS